MGGVLRILLWAISLGYKLLLGPMMLSPIFILLQGLKSFCMYGSLGSHMMSVGLPTPHVPLIIADRTVGEFLDAGQAFYSTDFWSLWDLGIVAIGVAFFICSKIIHALVLIRGRRDFDPPKEDGAMELR
jgi:hypothetical protein